jgi:hypothetical protein
VTARPTRAEREALKAGVPLDLIAPAAAPYPPLYKGKPHRQSCTVFAKPPATGAGECTCDLGQGKT